jgi:4-amino-4-deoxy-L-arabinose transferase-like glycosyltransferase
LALTSAVQKSPTMDEQNHIARGAAYLGTGDPRLSVEHPPLVNLLSALPAHLLLDLRLPLDTFFWEVGEWYQFADLFLWETNANADQIVFLARLPIIGLGLILVSLVFRCADARFGPGGGLLAAAFLALDPNFLAHTRLSTTDVGGACFVFLAACALWRAVRHPTLGHTLGSGLALGLALSSKLSNLLFGPIFGLAILVEALVVGRRHIGRRCIARAARNLATLALAATLGLLVVWSTYSFQIGRLSENGPLLPAPLYLKGIGAILDFTTGGRPAYLLGEYSHQGWWYYFLVAFAVKTPLATIAALLLATVVTLHRSNTKGSGGAPGAIADDIVLLIPPVAYFLVVTSSSLNIGYRHLLPMLPFLAVHVGRLDQPAAPPANQPVGHFTRLPRLLLPALLALWLTLATMCIYPHFLAFFNPIGGGPDEGWHILADSNIDWGQDLKELKAWTEREGVERVRLSWFGSARPEHYGINFDLLPGVPHGGLMCEQPPFNPEQPEPGLYVISVSNLVGVSLCDPDLYAWFRARPPDAKVGYSLFVYEVLADG